MKARTGLMLMFGAAALVALSAWAADIFLGGRTKITSMHPTTNNFFVLMGDHSAAVYRAIPPSNVVEVLKTMPNFPLNTTNYVDGSVTSAKIEAALTRDTEWDSLAKINAATTDADAVTDARTLTVAGTANEITSSAGAQDLTANRTWTLSLPATIDLGGKTSLEIPNGAAPTTDAAGELALDTTITDHKGLLQYFTGSDEMLVIAIPRAQLTTTDGHVVKYNAASDRLEMGAVAGTGDVVGPASSTDNAIARFDGTGGKTLQNSGVTIDDSANMSTAGTITALALIGSGSGAGLFELQDTDGSHHFRIVPTGTTTTNSHMILPPNPEDGFWEFSLSQGTNITVSWVKSSGTKNIMRADSPFATNATFLTMLNIPNGAAPVTDANGEIAIDNTITDHKGLIQYYSGATELLAVAIPRSALTSTDGHVIKYNATTDQFEMAVDSTGSGGDSASVNATAVSDSFSLTNTTGSATAAGTTWSVAAQADPNPDLVSIAIDAASSTVAGIVTAQAQTFAGIKTFTQGATAGGAIAFTEDSDNGANTITVKAADTVASDKTATFPDATGTVVLEDNTATLTGKTFDAAATGNTLKAKGYIYLMGSGWNNLSGVTVPNTNDFGANTFMRPVFSNSADEASNWVEWRIKVPPDIDTAVNLRAEIDFELTATDTGTHRYVLSMDDIATSAGIGGTMAQAVNFDFAGDGSGAANDAEQVAFTTLTSWNANVTAGRYWVIRLARDGNASQDASTVDSRLLQVTIEYGISQ